MNIIKLKDPATGDIILVTPNNSGGFTYTNVDGTAYTGNPLLLVESCCDSATNTFLELSDTPSIYLPGESFQVNAAGTGLEYTTTVINTSTAADSTDASYTGTNFLTHKVRDGVLEISGILNHNSLPIGVYNILPPTWFAANGINITGLNVFGGKTVSTDAAGTIEGMFTINSGGLNLNQSAIGTGNNYIHIQIIL